MIREFITSILELNQTFLTLNKNANRGIQLRHICLFCANTCTAISDMVNV